VEARTAAAAAVDGDAAVAADSHRRVAELTTQLAAVTTVHAGCGDALKIANDATAAATTAAEVAANKYGEHGATVAAEAAAAARDEADEAKEALAAVTRTLCARAAVRTDASSTLANLIPQVGSHTIHFVLFYCRYFIPCCNSTRLSSPSNYLTLSQMYGLSIVPHVGVVVVSGPIDGIIMNVITCCLPFNAHLLFSFFQLLIYSLCRTGGSCLCQWSDGRHFNNGRARRNACL
jgi:hypothetical protein